MKSWPAYLCLGALILGAPTGSFAQTGAAVTAGITPDEAVSAIGKPNFRHSLPDPSHSGEVVSTYNWRKAGKAAPLATDDRAKSATRGSEQAKAPPTAQPQQHEASHFHPINTPLDYIFYPVRVALIYLGAGINCLGGGGCQSPYLPAPSQD
jgi:hypothetical protein